MNDLNNNSLLSNLTHYTIKIADLVIEIETKSPGIYGYCIHYLTNEQPDIKVRIFEKDIQNEISRIKPKPQYINTIYLESIALYRKIAEAALNYNILLMHGAVIAHEDRAFMFIASSGTGKTTHIRQWLEKDEKAFVVNGDKPLVKLSEGKAFVCGTPWCGKERMETNIIVELDAIIYLERSEYNSIKEIDFKAAIPYLLQCTHRPSDIMKMKKTLELLSLLQNKVRFFKFNINNFKDDCFKIAFEELVGTYETY